MLNKENEIYVVVISCTRLKRNSYKIELADAQGEIFEIIAHEETVLEYRLVVGKELDKYTFDKLQNSKDYQKAYSYAVDILSRRLYTEKEVRRKLAARETTDDVVDAVVAKLLEIELLKDISFATAYIEGQVETGKKSRRRIISDLKEKGVSANIIDDLDDLFNKKSESTLIMKEVDKSYHRYSRKGLSDFDVRSKVIQALGRKGFDFDEVQRQYEFFIEDLAVDGD